MAYWLLPRVEGVFHLTLGRETERIAPPIQLLKIQPTMMRVGRRWLFLVAALIWGFPGVVITSKGVAAYGSVADEQMWWHLAITTVVLVGFGFMFGRVVARYTAHILSRPERVSPISTFPPRGWLLLGIMMCLGGALRLAPFVPNGFIASFYSGLGPMLLVSALRFFLCFLAPPTKN